MCPGSARCPRNACREASRAILSDQSPLRANRLTVKGLGTSDPIGKQRDDVWIAVYRNQLSVP